MHTIRVVTASLLFHASTASFVLFIQENYEISYLIISVIGFMLSYFIFPSRARDKLGDALDLFDILELVIELPFELLKLPFRFVFRALKLLDIW